MAPAIYDQRYAEMIDEDYGRCLIANHGPALLRAGAAHMSAVASANGDRPRLLDIGCNTGAFLRQVEQTLGVAALGLDTNAIALSHAVARGSPVLQAQAEKLPFADAALDLIFSQHTFEHVADTGVVLREIRRVLKVGGKAFIIVPINFLGFEVIGVAYDSLPLEQRTWLRAWRYARQLHCSPLGGPLGGSRQHVQRILAEHDVKLRVTGGWRWDILANFLVLEH